MKRRGLLAIFGLFLLACAARGNDAQVRGAWQYHEDSVTYNITFADNHAYVETMRHVDEPVRDARSRRREHLHRRQVVRQRHLRRPVDPRQRRGRERLHQAVLHLE